MSATPEQELLELSRELLSSIDEGNWETYSTFCDPTISAFEPEGVGNLIEGLPFHEFYFNRETDTGRHQSSISSPQVRMLGDDVALVTYVRLVQHEDRRGRLKTTACEETRVWQLQEEGWKHVHFHRSPAGKIRN
jgi:ketosteroid isomerase-like protein